jgi:hypothetical protein
MWHLFQVTLKLISPLHIGWKRSSNLQQTRMYVPARNIWGAFIAQLSVTDGKYFEMKTKVNQQFRFSYFYPSTAVEQVSLWPWDDEELFSWLYLNSYVSTALNEKAADRGFLHETEYIAPRTRENQQVYLLGYVLVRKDAVLPWQEILNHLRLGGERNSGWGRVQKEACIIKDTNSFMFDNDKYPLNYESEQPFITIQKRAPFLAHVLAGQEQDYQGILEPLIGRNTVSQTEGRGFGEKIMNRICWVPGTVCGESQQKFVIEPEGFWNLNPLSEK